MHREIRICGSTLEEMGGYESCLFDEDKLGSYMIERQEETSSDSKDQHKKQEPSIEVESLKENEDSLDDEQTRTASQKGVWAALRAAKARV